MTLSHDEFVIEIEAPAIAGAREAFDRALTAVFSNWKARIRGNLDRGRSGGAAEVSVEFQKGYPAGSEKVRRFQQTIRLPIRPGEGVAFPLIDRVWFEI